MRRLMLTIAVVLGLAVVEVKAQGHGAPAPKAHDAPAAKGHETPAAKQETPVAKKEPAAKEHAVKEVAAKEPAAKEPAAKEGAAKEPAAGAPVDVATVLKRIEKHVAEVTEISRARPAVRSAPVAETKKSPPPRPTAHARVAAAVPPPATPLRVELDWRAPLLVWPDETLRPDIAVSGVRAEAAEQQVGDDQRHDDVEGLAANERERGASLISGYKPAQ